MSSVLFAALVVAFAATGAHGKCPASIDAVTATVTEAYHGSRSTTDWTFSPTSLSALTPKGARDCGLGYIAQFNGVNCVSKCDKQEAAPVSFNDGCQYSFGDGSSRYFNLKLTCDASASALTLGNEVQVTRDSSTYRYTYDFIGRYAGACEESTPVVPTAAPPAESKATIMMLVIISVALSVVGVVLGAIALVMIYKRSRPQGDASVTGYVLNTDGNINSALIVKQFHA